MTVMGTFLRDMSSHVAALVPTVRQGSAGDIEIEGSAVFKDYRAIAFLDEKHTRCALFIRGQIRPQAAVPIDLPPELGGHVSVQVKRARRTVRITPGAGEALPKIAIRLEADALLGDQSGTGNALSEEMLQAVSRGASQALEDDARRLIRYAQENLREDIFGLGEIIRKTRPRLWARLDWEKDFPHVEILLTANLKVKYIGQVGKP